MDLRINEVELKLARPLQAAWGRTETRQLFLIELETADGLIGRGEASPLPGYDAVSVQECREALESCKQALKGVSEATAAFDACRAATEVPHALSAIDMALWDAAGKRENKSVAELLTEDPLLRIAVNASINAEHPELAADLAGRAIGRGHHTVKVKVGVADDLRRVELVRESIGPETALRLDANGAWTVNEALSAIDGLSQFGIELIEEPVHGVERLRELRERLPVRIAMDETSDHPGAISSGAADVVVLKVGRSGGISGLLARATLARATGAEVLIASAWDGPLGIAAGVHVAAALGITAACGLATLNVFDPHALVDNGVGLSSLSQLGAALAVQDGDIVVPTTDGLL